MKPSTNTAAERYAVLDAAILKAIGEGKDVFYRINAATGHLAAPYSNQHGQTFRVVDRRLQALRKRHLAIFKRGKWLLPETVNVQ